MSTKLFSELGLSPEILKAIDKLGFEKAAPIQTAAIPVLMAGHDVVGQSQTGSGKTAAFAIPAIEKVDAHKRVVQVLVLCPTRELAVQVSEEIHKLALFKRGIVALPVYGGQSYERQFMGLRAGAQIVIGTPGRVMDHMRRGTLRLDMVKMVILDEVDVMLNMGFREDIEFILQSVPAERQTVVFSATIPRPIQELIQKYSRDPQQIKIEQTAMTIPAIEQVYYEIDRRMKVDLLTRLIDIHDLKLGIIFCNTKRMVDDLVDHLNAQGYSADRLHGDMTQGMRERVMNKFRKSGLEFLVATDVAARGIDVDDVQVVFNYDLPYDPEDYVHRIGRTGRAGRSGRAISFVAGRELFQIQLIERFTRVKIQRGKPPTVAEVAEAKNTVFLDKLRATLQSGDYKKQDTLIERLLEEGFTSTDIASALIHHLQAGEAAPVTAQVREESPGRPSRPEHADRMDRESYRYEPRPREDFQRDRPPFRERTRDVDQDRGRDMGRGRDAAPPRPEFQRERGLGGPFRAPTAAPAARPAAGARPNPPAGLGPAKVKAPAAAARPVSNMPKPPPPAPPVSDDLEAPEVVEEIREVAPVTAPAPKAAAVKAEAELEAVAKPAKVEFQEKPAVKNRFAPAKKIVRQPGKVKLHLNVGEEMGVQAQDVVASILGETGLPPQAVGVVDIRERHLFVEVDEDNANAIVAKLNRAQLKGRKLRVKLANANPLTPE